MKPRLRIESGPQRGHDYDLQGPFVIGRAASCDLVLTDDSCSRMHARITPEGTRVKIEDLGSTNGTLVNGERTRHQFLEDGDRVTIGDTVLRFEAGAFDPAKTVILSAPVRDTANVTGELPLDVKSPAGADGDSRSLAALLHLVDSTRGVPEVHAIGRALCAALSELFESSRAAVLLFHPGSLDPRDANQVSVPDMRLDPSRPWIARALQRRRAILLEDKGKGGKNSLFGIVVPCFDRDQPQLLLYADRRGRAFDATDLEACLRVTALALALLQSATMHERLRLELAEFRTRSDAERRIVGQSEAHRTTIHSVRSYAAKADQAVLLIGETGTGKEMLAHLLHDASPRADGPFLAVNCSATAANLLEIELFGSGENDARQSTLERASGGTLFLDELDALDLPTQARLASVLRSRKLAREHGGREVPLDIRLVAASDRDLANLAGQGNFHEELLALLAQATIKIPALRERVEDIPLLADHFLKHHVRRMNRSVRRIAPEAQKLINAYPWPGNVRELSNVIERAVILCRNDSIGPELLPFSSDQAVTESELALEFVEKHAILRALSWCQGKKGQAAKVLGISWPTLNKKIADYGIEMPEKG